MKDSLNDLFHERFRGHEAPVDPATWQVIEARLLTTAPAADPVNELFRERFSGHEVNVAPGAWQHIGSQLGHSAGFGSFGWIAAGIGGVVLTGGLIYLLSGSPDEVAIAQPRQQQEVVVTDQGTPSQLNTEPIALIAERAEEEAPVVRERSSTTIVPAVTTGSGEAVVVPSSQQDDLSAAGTSGMMDTSGAPVVRGIIAAIEDAAERELQLAQQAADDDQRKLPQGTENQQHAFEPEGEATAPEVKEPCTLYLENIFTPNNDGINDAYEVDPPPCVTSARIRIFSISGQLVFTMNNYEPWVGANCEEGWYIVAGEASTLDGTMIPVKGTVFLKRSNN